MEHFHLSDAVTLFAEQTSLITSLWTLYTLATFTAVGFAITSQPSRAVSIPLTLGFLAFTTGHLLLLESVLEVQNTLEIEITSLLKNAADPSGFSKSLLLLTHNASSIPWSIFFHLAIDCSALAIFLYRVYAGGPSRESRLS